MSYCLVENKKIIDGPRSLPKNWRNITRLDLADADFLKEKGWLPVNIKEPIYDKSFQHLSAPIFIIEENIIQQLYNVIDYTDEELYEIQNAKKESLLETINAEVNEYISRVYDIGTQNSLNAIYTKRSTPDSVRDLLDPIWEWIESILQYYYERKLTINKGIDLENITWDFSKFDVTIPSITLGDLMK